MARASRLAVPPASIWAKTGTTVAFARRAVAAAGAVAGVERRGARSGAPFDVQRSAPCRRHARQVRAPVASPRDGQRAKSARETSIAVTGVRTIGPSPARPHERALVTPILDCSSRIHAPAAATQSGVLSSRLASGLASRLWRRARSAHKVTDFPGPPQAAACHPRAPPNQRPPSAATLATAEAELAPITKSSV